ncbi:MAG: thioredoxin domain-containing protein, partial [Gammaproteobacteria bacterium]|nr:thioredoxin domain-containing protein [Gammaproteobacteria bacterium]
MKIFFLFISLAVTFSADAAPFNNTLKNHASPYLALHGTDPVAWQEWNKETVARAKREGKLIYVSSGYFSCHWCHVMQRESYKNAEVAQILNKYFIPVKVDREINSALDSHLIDFVERTQGRAGWPLNVFVTPDGYPLVGMTYVPTNNFIEILNNLKTRWQLERAVLEDIAKSATNELSTAVAEGSENIADGLAKEYLKRFLLQADTMADDMSGGFGQQNKFPSYPQLNLMLMAYENTPEKPFKQFLLLTLNKMASQGLYDQLGGGFFRYTVDPIWQVPHFEKMLY